MNIFKFFVFKLFAKKKIFSTFNWKLSRYGSYVSITKYWGAAIEQSRNVGEWTAEIHSSDFYFHVRRQGFSSLREAQLWVETHFENLKKISTLE